MKRNNSRTFIMALAVVMLIAMAPALARIAADDIPENDSTMSLPADTPPMTTRDASTNSSLKRSVGSSKGDSDSAFALLRHCSGTRLYGGGGILRLRSFYKQKGNDSLSLDCLMKSARLAPGNDTYSGEYLARHYISRRLRQGSDRLREPLQRSSRPK